MRIIVVNAGSSSIKYQSFTLDDCTIVVKGTLDRIGTREARFKRRWLTDAGGWEEISETLPIADHHEGFRFLLETSERYPTTRITPGAFFGFGHRVVHGGEAFREPVIVDDEVIRQIKDLIPLAPLHNPSNLAAIEVLRTLQQQPTRSFENVLFHAILGHPVQFSPEIGQLFVVKLDDVETIEHQCGIGKMGHHSLDVRIGHVDGHRLNMCSGFVHAFEEWLKGPDILAFTHVDYRTAGQVQDHRYKLVSPPKGDLVYGNASQMPKLGLGEFPAQATLLDVLDHVPTYAQMTSDVSNRHVLGELKDIAFELPDEALVLIGKTDLDLPYHPAGEALDALDGQFDDNLLESKTRRPESPFHCPSLDEIPGTTTRAFQGSGGLFHGEDDLSPHELRPLMPVSHDVQSVVQ